MRLRSILRLFVPLTAVVADGLSSGQVLPISCISRHIDTGEHKFDENNNIIYTPFPICEETQKPLELSYLKDESINCTISLVDETYHLFQLYMHQDVPLSCRMPVTSTAYVPLTFNFRGVTEKSHVDIDPTLNVLMFFRETAGSTEASDSVIEGSMSHGALPVSGIGFSSAYAPLQRHTIGSKMTIELSVRWYGGRHLPAYSSSHYTLTTTMLYCTATATATIIIVAGIIYGVIIPKKLRHIGGDDYSKLD